MTVLSPSANTPNFPRPVRLAARLVLALAILPCLLMAMQVTGYLDFTAISAPSNPAAGGRVFFNTSTGKLACLDSSGADCMPSGGGGGGGTVTVGPYSGLGSCTTTAFTYVVTGSPLMAYCNGSSTMGFTAFGANFPGPVLLNSSFTDTLGSSATWGNSASGVMTGSMSASNVYQARLKASPAGDFTATLYFSMAGDYPGGATQIGLFGVNAAKDKAVLAAMTAQNGYWTLGAYLCNPINSCSQAGEANFRGLPQQFMILRIVKSSVAANVDFSVDGGSQFFRVGGVFISSIDDVSFLGPTMISPAFGGTSGTFFAMEVQ